MIQIKNIICFALLAATTQAASEADFNFNKTFIPDTSMAKPTRGTEMSDLIFHTTFRRISDATADTGGSNIAAVVYSRWTPLNSNGKYLYFQRTVGWDDAMIYHADTGSLYKILPKKTTIDGATNKNFVTLESAELRWDYTGQYPSRCYYVAGTKFYRYDVDADRANLVHDFSKEFPGAERILNNVEGDSSADSRYWAWMVQGPYDGSFFPMLAVITYDKQTDTILGAMDAAKYKALGGKYNSLPTPNMVEISPSGTKVVFHVNRCWDPGSRPLDIGGVFDGPHAWDLNFTNPVKVSIDETHSGWAWGYDGSELFVSQNNRDDMIEARDIHTGQITQILYHGDLGWNNGMHFARMPQHVKGWILMSTYTKPPNKDWGDNQLLMVELKDKTKSPRVWRLGHTHNNYNEYYAEGFAAMSQFGDKLWWGAKWPGQNNIESYEMTLPYHWWDTLRGIYTDGHNPAPRATDIAPDTNVSIHILGADGNVVDPASLIMTVDGTTVYNGSSPGSYPNTVLSGTGADYLLIYNPPQLFSLSKTVSVTVDARTTAAPPLLMSQDAYGFTIAAVQNADTSPPYITTVTPGDGETNVPITRKILVHVRDDVYGVDQRSIIMTVNGVIVFNGSQSSAYPQTTITGNPKDYLLTYTPGVPYPENQKIVVTIDAQDLASTPNVMPRAQYTFNTSEPALQPAAITSTNTILVVGSVDGKGTVNPSKGETAKIYFNGKEAGAYTCKIFTMNGEQIWTDSRDNTQTGMFEWAAKETASGTYLVMIKGPAGFKEIKKIIILK